MVSDLPKVVTVNISQVEKKKKESTEPTQHNTKKLRQQNR